MLKKSTLLLLVLCLAACSGRTTPVPTPSGPQVDAEEAAVYAALVKAQFPAAMLVVMDTTATDVGSSTDLEKTLQYVLENMRSVDAATVDSFRSRNAAPGPVRADMDLGVPYSLFSRDQLNAMFNVNQDGWQAFYDKFPDAPGMLTVSHVGFNAAFDQALVYAGIQSQALAGAGHYFLLVKVDGVWTVDQQVMTWIS
jgi:hypothetical protein